MNWETLVTVLGALGGLELVKWLYNIIANRRNNARINEAEADASEFHVLEEQIQFLQQQLKDKEERFVEQTNLLRDTQRDLLLLEKEKAVMEVEYLKRIAELELELARVRCNDEFCPFRQPPTATTPPKPGVTKEKYFEQREKDDTPDD